MGIIFGPIDLCAKLIATAFLSLSSAEVARAKNDNDDHAAHNNAKADAETDAHTVADADDADPLTGNAR